jgi:hypothetical protein
MSFINSTLPSPNLQFILIIIKMVKFHNYYYFLFYSYQDFLNIQSSQIQHLLVIEFPLEYLITPIYIFRKSYLFLLFFHQDSI